MPRLAQKFSKSVNSVWIGWNVHDV
jgi:hypothetical protein